MFEKKSSSSSQVLHIASNHMKGGDFMGIEQDDPAIAAATKEALSKIEGLRVLEQPWGHRPVEPAIGPDQGRVVTENPRFPEVSDRTRSDTAGEIAASTDPLLRQP